MPYIFFKVAIYLKIKKKAPTVLYIENELVNCKTSCYKVIRKKNLKTRIIIKKQKNKPHKTKKLEIRNFG